jgi:phosphatidylserine/phosphatidylglycerophosphate/cardiolipin synthase-like enzyme
MAKFLNTRKAVAAIEELIKEADTKLILISPYLKLSKDFKELLTYRNNQDKITTIIFGKQELKPDEMKFLESLRFVILKFNEDLHAKCYVNDKQMVITSLNLYEFSMANNKEMGVLIDLNDENDKSLYDEAYKEIDYIENTSQKFKFNINNTDEDSKSTKVTKINIKKNLSEGHCIRCDAKIKLNPEHPLCPKCYKNWSKYSDPKYEEKFCHLCGKGNKSSLEKPICYSCYKKTK